ncbi:hypothetical protein MTR_0165s0050 [Medicago truncatula]|uniref:Uncharacterized protein n=1 Tax=Medicago truncatula TaxID=3880 RepID=A0A072TG16_MEDTR|nr:hypothetical protein MTR_0165s0050 [Medicago truncatula]
MLTEMNGSEGGTGFYFRAGREVKAIREDCPPGKEERCQGAVIYLDQFPEALKIKVLELGRLSEPVSEIFCKLLELVRLSEQGGRLREHVQFQQPLIFVPGFRRPIQTL